MIDTAALAERFLTTLEARDWDAWQELLSEDVTYELPQTRERIRGRAAYLKFNQTYPGDWHLTPKVIIGDADRAVIWFGWAVRGPENEESGDAQVFFEFDEDGVITKVTDFWPEPYRAPARPEGLFERW